MKKGLFLVLVIWVASLGYGEGQKIGFGFMGGLGWGSGIYTADKGSEVVSSYHFKDPSTDTAYSYDFGIQFYYFPWRNVALTFGIASETRRLKVLYERDGDTDPEDDWKNYYDYTLTSHFTTLNLGARYYTDQEYLFGGKVFFGGGAYYGFHRGDMDISVEDVEINLGWFARLMLFNVFNMAKKSHSKVYEGSNASVKDDQGLYLETGLVFPLSDNISFDFFVKYSFSLTKIYEPKSTDAADQRRIREVSPRTFLMHISFSFLFNIGSDSKAGDEPIPAAEEQTSSLRRGSLRLDSNANQ